MKLRLSLLSASAICASVTSTPLLAQTAATADVGEIIVTARRREEALQDVPISVSALSGAQIEKAGITDVQSLQYRTPSLSITSGQSQRNTVAFAIRGQRAQETQLFTDPPVGTYFAEVVQPRPYGFGKTFYDLQSVQVLKGVQGTLFGRNMTGGAVLVEPMHPKLNEFSGEVRGQYGNYDMKDLYGFVNIPLGDKFAIRVAGKTHKRDGWAHDVTSGTDLDNQNFNTFRVSVLAKPFDGFESLTIFDWYRSNENGTASFATELYQPSVVTNYENFRKAGLITANIPAQFAAAQQLFAQKKFTLASGSGNGSNLDVFGSPYEKIKNWGITNKTSWELSDALTLKNIFGYRKERRDTVQDYDGLPAFLIAPYQYARTRNISEELQLQGKMFEDKLNFILGAYYFEEKGVDGSLANTLPELNMILSGKSTFTTPASLFVTANPGRGYARTAAVFAAGTYHFTDQLSLSGGVRYNYDKRKITVSPTKPNLQTCSFTPATTPPTPLAQCFYTNQKSFKEVTYDVTAQYEPSEHITTYAALRHGFRSGGFSTRATSAVTLAPFRPEFVDEYEVGLKTNSHIAGGRLTTSTALFLQNGTDVQKQRATLINGNVVTIVDNTARQRNTGGEFEATYSTNGFSLTGFYSYTKVKIRPALNGVGGPGQLTIPTFTGSLTLNEIDQRGTPKHQLGATATVSPPIPENLGSLDLIGNVTWRSKIYLDDFEVGGLQPSYTLVNARAEWNNIGKSGVSVAAFANNLLNKTYRIGTLGLIAEKLGFSASVYGEPRMYGLEVGFKF